MNTKNTKSTLVERVRSLIAGTQKHSPNGSFTLGGAAYTTASLVQVLQGLADAIASVDAARANWKDALKREQDERAKVDPVIRDYRSWLVATYGNAPATLADYGVTPRKVPTPLTADQLVAAVTKRTQTRAARHTLGSKQKARIKGAPATPATAGTATAPPIAPVTPATAPAGSPPAAPPPVKPA